MIKISAFFLISLFVQFTFGSVPVPREIERRLVQADTLVFSLKPEEYIRFCEKILEDSKKIAYSRGVAYSSLKIAILLNSHAEYEKGDKYLKIAEQEEYSRESETFYAKLNNTWAERCYHTGLYKESIKYFRNMLSPLIKKDGFMSGLANNGISVCFSKLNQPDSAFFYRRRAYFSLTKLDTYHAKCMRAVVAANLGMQFSENCQMDSAKYYLIIAQTSAKKLNNWSVRITSESSFGLFYLNNDRPDSAIFHFKTALDLSLKHNQMHESRAVYEGLYTAYKLIDNKPQANKYYGLYRSLSDSLGVNKNVSVVMRSMVEEHQKVLDQKKSRLIKVAITISTCLLLTVLLIYLRIKRNRQQRKRMIKEKEEISKTVLNVQIQQEENAIGWLTELAKTKDPTFFVKFNELYPGFKGKILSKYPDLNSADVEFCSYLRMDFDTKEIARFANMSVRAAEAKKYRIRKKLNISGSDDINTFIINI